MVLPQLGHAKETRVWNHEAILVQLVRVHDNPNKAQRAEVKAVTYHCSKEMIQR
jgi:hypothetical protein